MKFKINQKELSKALSILVKAVATRTSMEILKGIYFLTGDDEIILASNNLEIGIQTTIKCEIIEKGSIVIDSKVISDIVRKLPNEIITFETSKDINYVEIRCQNINFSIKYIPSSDFPMPEYIDEKLYFNIDAKDFKSLIEKTGYAISTNESKPDLTSHFIRIENSNMTVFSIDGYRMAVIDKKISDLSFDLNEFVVQGKIMLSISSIIDDSVDYIKFAYDDRHISVIIGETVITTNLVLQPFKDFKMLIPTSFNSTCKINVNDLKNAIDRISLLADNDLIVLETSGNMMKINSKSNDIGQAIEVIDVKLDGDNFVIGFNSNYLLDAIKYIDQDYIEMNVIDSVSASVITPENDKSYINLILPVRIR